SGLRLHLLGQTLFLMGLRTQTPLPVLSCAVTLSTATALPHGLVRLSERRTRSSSRMEPTWIGSLAVAKWQTARSSLTVISATIRFSMPESSRSQTLVELRLRLVMQIE